LGAEGGAVSVGTTYAVLIGIETNQQRGIGSVQFAQADAAAMKDLLVQNLGVPAENITVWLDFEATKSVFENELPYVIRQLAPGDRFIFFYAGHGFFANGTNRLTTWDSHPGNLFGTTVSLEDVLLGPLKSRQGVSSLVFIDACAADLKTNLVQARDIVSDLTPNEFEALVRSTDHSAAFFACSPNEKAYPSDSLQHGIWTYHLIKALRGEAEDAFHRERWITGDSLRNYLALAVPAFIRASAKIQGEQRPFAILGSNGPFGIHQVPPSDSPKSASPASPAKIDDSEPELTSEQSSAHNSGNRPRIMLSTVQGHYNQWKGDVFTLNHLGGDAAQYIEIDPINFEGFSKVSLRFDPVPFIGQANPAATVHFHVVTGDDGVPRHADKPSFVMMSFVYDAQNLSKPEVSYPMVARYKWGTKTEEENFRITWDNNRRRLTIWPATNDAEPQKNQKHNVVFLNAAFVKIAYSGPGFSDRTDGMHSFSEVEGANTGDMIGLVARFRNEAIYGEDVAAVRAVRAHLKLFDKNNHEIGTGYSSALWLGHRNDAFDLVPNGPGGSVLVCLGSKTKARVRWKTRASIDRLHDNLMELNDGYPSRAEVALLDSRDRLLLAPIVLEVTETSGELSVVRRQ
jgi:hypothetical protein